MIATFDPARLPAMIQQQVSTAIASLERRLAAQERAAGFLGDNTIDGTVNLVQGSITAPSIAAGSITADLIDVSSLDALTAVMGNLTVNGTLTVGAGGEIRTTIGNQVTKFSSGGLRSYDSPSGVDTFNLSAATGILTAKMVIQTGTQMPLGFIGGGNILPDSSFEGLNAATIYQGSGATITAVPLAGAFHGLRAMQVTSTAAANFSLRHFANRVNVTAGKFYTATAYVMPSTFTGSARVYLDTYNSSAVRVAATPSADVPLVNNVWTRISVTKLAEPTAVTAQLIVEGIAAGAIGQVMYVDGVQLEVGEIATAYAPRPDEVLPGSVTVNELAANSVSATQLQTDSVISAKILAGAVTAAKFSGIVAGGNLLSNATTSFEQDVAGWGTVSSPFINTGSTVVRDATRAYYGSASCRVTVGTTANQGAAAIQVDGPWRNGVKYTASAYVRADSTQTLQIAFGEQAGVDAVYAAASVGTTWTRLSVTWTPTADRLQASLAIYRTGATAFSYNFDAVQIEQGDVPTAWRQYIAPASIEGSTITGALIQTAPATTNPRVFMDTANGLSMTDSGGNVVVRIKGGAGGIDLAAGAFPSATFDRRIRWLTTGGIVSADIYNLYSANYTDSINLNAYANSSASTALGNLTAFNQGNARSAQLRVSSLDQFQYVEARAYGSTVKLIDSDGKSEFARNRVPSTNQFSFGWGTGASDMISFYVDGTEVLRFNTAGYGPWPRIIY